MRNAIYSMLLKLRCNVRVEDWESEVLEDNREVIFILHIERCKKNTIQQKGPTTKKYIPLFV